MTTKAQKSTDAIVNAMANAAKEAVKEVRKGDVVDDIKASRRARVNGDGDMLMCELTLQKREGGPDPLCITVGEEIKFAKRGHKVVVPWYFVLHLLNNIERKYTQTTDENGKRQTTYDDVPSEPFQYRCINPAPGSEF